MNGTHLHNAQVAVADSLQIARELARALERVSDLRTGPLPALLALAEKAQSLECRLMAAEYHREMA